MNPAVPRIAVTAGEPAGIGPDLIAMLAQEAHPAELVVVGDPELLQARAARLGLPLRLRDYAADAAAQPAAAGELTVLPVRLAAPCAPGVLDIVNAPYVLETLRIAGQGCLEHAFAAVVTAPVQKSIINQAGVPFSGHTEFFADLCGRDFPVMLLCTDELRVALVTTHLPLADVPRHITRERVERIGGLLDAGLRTLFGIAQPRIAVLGLNPHAGEDGELGHEDNEQIAPAIAALQAHGIRASGPLPADTAFTQHALQHVDAVLAMYHDQGLPVLKHAGFGRAVNVTLGLPIIRTSVDHGTALDLAGTGEADSGSLRMALRYAIDFAQRAAQ